MTTSLWRLGTDTPDYGADDLSGIGAKITGGRWNRKGLPVVYTAATIALATLETVVHLGAGSLPLNRCLVRIDVPDDIWNAARPFPTTGLIGWDALPAGLVSLDFGDAWLQSRATVLQIVPSIVVPEEWNVLLNPAHPDMQRITATRIRRFTYDSRLRSS